MCTKLRFMYLCVGVYICHLRLTVDTTVKPVNQCFDYRTMLALWLYPNLQSTGTARWCRPMSKWVNGSEISSLMRSWVRNPWESPVFQPFAFYSYVALLRDCLLTFIHWNRIVKIWFLVGVAFGMVCKGVFLQEICAEVFKLFVRNGTGFQISNE